MEGAIYFVYLQKVFHHPKILNMRVYTENNQNVILDRYHFQCENLVYKKLMFPPQKNTLV